MKPRRITEKFLQVAIESYQDGESCAKLAKWGEVSRQGLWKAMKKAGVEKNRGSSMTVCDTCGKEFEKFNCQLKLRIKNYCSPECYYKSIENPDYMPNRHGQRIAKKVVLECGYYIGENEVIHHIDGNNKNNDPKNLLVFKNQSDHMKHHRNGNDDVVPIWPEKPKNVIKTVSDVPDRYRPPEFSGGVPKAKWGSK